MKVDDIIAKKLEEQEIVTLGMSLGKDSLACALVLKNLNIRYIPFYFYHIPDLGFVKKQIEYYEEALGTEIIQLPHPMLYDRLRHQDFQTLKMAKWLSRFNFGKMTFQKLIDFYLDDKNIEGNILDVVGMRAAESFNRREFFKKYGPIIEEKRKIYPIWNWKKQETKNYVTNNGIKLSDDYKIWDRSWDGLKYQFLVGVKQNYPDDFEKIKEYFPLIELEIKRYEFNKAYYEHLGQY